jgi:hypothetical protein
LLDFRALLNYRALLIFSVPDMVSWGVILIMSTGNPDLLGLL